MPPSNQARQTQDGAPSAAAVDLLKACEEAGVKSADSFAALKADADAFRAARAARRDAAKASAVVAYGAGTPLLQAATEDIEATADGPAFDRLCARIDADAEKASPAAGKTAQTRPTQNADVARDPATDAQGAAAAPGVLTIAEYNKLQK